MGWEGAVYGWVCGVSRCVACCNISMGYGALSSIILVLFTEQYPHPLRRKAYTPINLFFTRCILTLCNMTGVGSHILAADFSRYMYKSPHHSAPLQKINHSCIYKSHHFILVQNKNKKLRNILHRHIIYIQRILHYVILMVVQYNYM